MPRFYIDKKNLIIIIIIGVVVLGGAGVLLYNTLMPKPDEADQNVNNRNFTLPSSAPTAAVENLVSYRDPLGFALSYPDSLNVNTHPEDNANYADVEFGAPDQSKSVKILVSDTTYKTIDDWQKNDPDVKGTSAIDTTLGNLTAKKVSLDSSKKLITAAIWDGMLFEVVVWPSDDKKFAPVAEKIITGLNIPTTANYTDTTAPTSAPAATGDDSSVSTDEEVIQ